MVTGRTRLAARIAKYGYALSGAGVVVVGSVYAAGLGATAAFVALVATFPVFLFARQFAQRELARLPAMQADAHARGDADALAEVRKIWTSLGAFGPRADALSRLLEGEELALRERWKEARDAFAAVDGSVLPEAHAQNVKSWLAYAMAEAGDPLRALDVIDDAIAAAHRTNQPHRHLVLTRARVLVLLGRPADALPLLEESVKERDVHDRALNLRFYWLALANDALGNDDAARHAFERCASLDGPFQEKARRALASRTPFRG